MVATRAAFFGLGLNFSLTGTEHVPREGGAVLAINHTGWLDFTFAGLAAHPSGRLVRFMAKESIFANPVAGPLMRGMKHIPVDREAGAAAYRAAVTALRQGELIGVFPETTISRSFELLPFKSGVGPDGRLRQGADPAHRHLGLAAGLDRRPSPSRLTAPHPHQHRRAASDHGRSR